MARFPSNPQQVLRPQDLVVLLRLALPFEPVPRYAVLGAELGITASEAHAALRQFLQHGARYCFPASQGGMTRGIPTWYAASPLMEQIRPGNDPPPVWPWKNGTTRGLAFCPLYPSVPEAAARNPALGELLALFDAVRGVAAEWLRDSNRDGTGVPGHQAGGLSRSRPGQLSLQSRSGGPDGGGGRPRLAAG